jgi:hypothetical protein
MTMTFHRQIATPDAAPAEGLGARLGDSLASLLSKIRAAVETCADHYAAAAICEQLSALSDAELGRRGLSRATLARDVQAACDRRVFE